jgi:hypothetical protein
MVLFASGSGPRRGCVPKRLELVESTSPRGLHIDFTDKAGKIHSTLLQFCRVYLLLQRQRRGAASDYTVHIKAAYAPYSYCTAAELFITCCGSAHPPFFLPRASCLQAFSSGKISHMQVG